MGKPYRLMTEDIFKLAKGVSLSTLDTSNRQAMFLAQLPPDRQLQLSQKLYELLSCLGTPLSLSGLAQAYATRTGESLSEKQLTQIVYERLLPHQLVQNLFSQGEKSIDGADTPTPDSSRSMLSMHLRRDVLPARM